MIINFLELAIIHRRKKHVSERIRIAREIVTMIETEIEIGIEPSSVEKIAVPRDPQIAIREEGRKILKDKNDRTRHGFSIAREKPNDHDPPRDRRIYRIPLKHPEDPTRTIEQPRRPPLQPLLSQQLRRLVYQNSLFVNLKKTLKTQ